MVMSTEPDDAAADDSWRELVEALSEGADVDATWVPLADAATAAGVSRSALRAWYRSGQIPSRLESGPHGPQRMVPRELVLERALHGRGRLAPVETADPSPPPDLIHLLVTTIVERDDRLERRITELEHRVEAVLTRAVAAETELDLWRRGWRPSSSEPA
jgi:transposase